MGNDVCQQVRDEIATVDKGVEWDVLSEAMRTGVPAILWGVPGIGKTAMVRQAAKQLGREHMTFIASIHEPTDINGLPFCNTETGTVDLLCPSWAKYADDHNVILILDEISNAPPAMQAAILRLVQERTVGEYTFKNNIPIVLCANPSECSAGGGDLVAPFANRIIHLFPQFDFARFKNFALGIVDPIVTVNHKNKWEDFLPQARSIIVSFLERNQAQCYAMPEEDSKKGLAWPSPRAWLDLCAPLLAACLADAAGDKTKTKRVLQEQLVAACVRAAVGTSAAQDWATYFLNMDLPNPEDIIANPKNWEIPETRGDVVFVAGQCVIANVIANQSTARGNAAYTMIGRINKTTHKDISFTLFTSLFNSGVYPMNVLSQENKDLVIQFLPQLYISNGTSK